jgi:hypothetical protein
MLDSPTQPRTAPTNSLIRQLCSILLYAECLVRRPHRFHQRTEPPWLAAKPQIALPSQTAPGPTMRRKPNDNDFAADEPNPGIGHNGHGMDPGPDQGYRISLNIPEWVSDEKVRAFESALRDQGPHPDRLAAPDQAAFRARASEISHRAFRLYDAALDMGTGAASLTLRSWATWPGSTGRMRHRYQGARRRAPHQSSALYGGQARGTKGAEGPACADRHI